MKSFQKVLVSLLVSTVVAGGFLLAGVLGIFDALEFTFYENRAEERARSELRFALEGLEDFRTSVIERGRAIVGQEAFYKAYLVNQTAELIQARRTQFQEALLENPGLSSLRIVDPDPAVRRLYYSTRLSDIEESSSQRVVYRSLERLEDLPPTLIGPSDQSEIEFRVLPASDGFMLQLPVFDDVQVYRGTAIFQGSFRPLYTELFKSGLLSLDRGAYFLDEQTFILNVDDMSRARLRPESLSGIDSEGTSRLELDANRYAVIARSSANFRVLELLPEESLVLSPALKIFLVALVWSSVFLLCFLLLNLKQDPVVVVSDRLRKFQAGLIQEYLENRRDVDLKKWRSELRLRREEVYQQLLKGVPRGKTNKQLVDSMLDASWDEILEIFGNQKLLSGGGNLDVDRIEQVMQKVLAGLQSAAVPTLPPSQTRVAPPGRLDESVEGSASGPAEVAELEEIPELDESGESSTPGPEEVAELEEIPELEEADEGGAPDSLAAEDPADETIQELEELDELEEAGDEGDTEESAEIEELEELSVQDDDVSDLEEIPELEETDDGGAPESVAAEAPADETIQELEELDELEELSDQVETEDRAEVPIEPEVGHLDGHPARVPLSDRVLAMAEDAELAEELEQIAEEPVGEEVAQKTRSELQELDEEPEAMALVAVDAANLHQPVLVAAGGRGLELSGRAYIEELESVEGETGEPEVQARSIEAEGSESETIFEEDEAGVVTISSAVFPETDDEADAAGLRSGIEDLFELPEVDLSMDALPPVPKERLTRYRIRSHGDLVLTGDGFDFDRYAQPFRKDGPGLVKSLVTLSRLLKCRFAALFSQTDRGLFFLSGVGYSAAVDPVSPEDPLLAKYLSRRQVTLITKVEDYFYFLPQHEQELGTVEQLIFLPCAYNGEAAYLVFGPSIAFPSIDDFLGLFQRG